MKPSITSKKVSEGQKQSGVQLVVDATRKSMGVAIDELSVNGVLNSENFERIRARGNEVATAVTALVKKMLADMAENISGCLKLISGAETLTLDATDGKQTIAKAKDVFTWGIDGDFENWNLDVKSEPTKEQNVHVHEMIKDGDFRKIFGGLGDDLDQLCLTQSQIIQFVKNHKKWLRTDGWVTFFLFKMNGEFFVADVGVGSGGGLGVYVYRFANVGVWGAERRHRVVVPQLVPQTA